MEKNLRNYILDCIDGDSYGVTFNESLPPFDLERSKVNFLLTTFWDEYCRQYTSHRQVNGIRLLASWFQGLPSCFNLTFSDYDIEQIGREWGYVTSESTRDNFVRNWWIILACGVKELVFELRMAAWYDLFA